VFLPSYRSVQATFNRLHRQRMTVSHSWVHALCRSRASELRVRRRGRRACPLRVVPAGRAGSLDLTLTYVRGPDGQCWPVLGVIDQGSHMLLRLKVLAHKETWVLPGHVCLAIGTYGLPAAVRTDNEGIFTGWLWRCALKCFGIRRERIDVASPWQNGRIERLFGILKPLLRKLSLPSPLALQGALDEFAGSYNHVHATRTSAGSRRSRPGAARPGSMCAAARAVGSGCMR
jgi:transposase InsO family protein